MWLAVIFLPFVLILTGLHWNNFWMNKTTNERFGSKSDDSESLDKSYAATDAQSTSNRWKIDSLEKSSFMGPRNGNCVGNCFRMCNFKPPSQKRMAKELSVNLENY